MPQKLFVYSVGTLPQFSVPEEVGVIKAKCELQAKEILQFRKTAVSKKARSPIHGSVLISVCEEECVSELSRLGRGPSCGSRYTLLAELRVWEEGQGRLKVPQEDLEGAKVFRAAVCHVLDAEKTSRAQVY